MSSQDCNYPLVIFNDDLISTLSKHKENEIIDAIRFDFSSKTGRILRMEPLQTFKTISELSLIGHDISNINALQGLLNLKRINLSWNKLTTQSLTPLFSLQKLQ